MLPLADGVHRIHAHQVTGLDSRRVPVELLLRVHWSIPKIGAESRPARLNGPSSSIGPPGD